MSITKTRIYDAAVIGGGPAGTSAAIALARAGHSVLLLEKRSHQSFKLGESLPPLALNMVKQLLGPLDDRRIQDLGMSKVLGNLSCWQSHLAETRDFFVSPPGYGLRLDRQMFDQALRDTAVGLGVELVTGMSIGQIEFGEPCSITGRSRTQGPSTDLDREPATHQQQTFLARYLIDASGRQSIIAKAAGVKRHSDDSLFAYALRFSTEPDWDRDKLTRIEAGPLGWWYSARLNDQQRLLVLHTDEDLGAAHRAGAMSGFLAIFKRSRHLSALLQTYQYRPCSRLMGAPACGARLDMPVGRYWLAAGDAAQSYDPLSSQGIYQALRGGFMAGQSVTRALKQPEQISGGVPQAFSSYTNNLSEIWAEYRKHHQYYYRCQPRWLDQPFWQRRTIQIPLGNSPETTTGKSPAISANSGVMP